MSATTVRISDSTHRTLRDLAKREKAPMQTVLDRAIENYRRERILDIVNQTFAGLRSDQAAWNAEMQERDEWDVTTTDGIETK
jgi:predicted transcriptional regulator